MATNPPTTANPWLLAIDTSTERAGLAVTDGTRTSEITWHAGRNQTVGVLAEIDHLLGLAGITVDDLAAVAVALGPGMFNGLRVGISIAKGFHLANGTPLIGVSTLAVTAAPFLALGMQVAAVVAAGRGRVVWQVFPERAEPVNGAIDELAAALPAVGGPVVAAGDLDGAQAEHLRRVSGTTVPERAERERRAAVLAGIGWVRYVAGEVDDPVTLAPVYVHSGAGAARR